MIRKPIVSGKFYPSTFDSLNREIKNCFEGDLGPAVTPSKRTNKKLIAIITPHAGYSFSGQCAAWAYKQIGESKLPNTFVILAPNHTGIGTSGISLASFETPFGIVLNDVQLSKEISKESNVPLDEKPHAHEHAIEVQLPFLQYSCKEELNSIKIVPIIVSYDTHFKELGEAIYNSAKKNNKEIIVIVSSDFTHYGYDYGYYPFGLGDDVEEKIKKLEDAVIDKIKNKDVVGLEDLIKRTKLTICGIYPIYTLLYYLKKYEKENDKQIDAYILQRYTSLTIMKKNRDYYSGNNSNFVSYVAISFKPKE